MNAFAPSGTQVSPWEQINQLTAKARATDSERALLFVMANDTFALLPLLDGARRLASGARSVHFSDANGCVPQTPTSRFGRSAP